MPKDHDIYVLGVQECISGATFEALERYTHTHTHTHTHGRYKCTYMHTEHAYIHTHLHVLYLHTDSPFIHDEWTYTY